jgi:uncharacterized caspase-like protein
MSARFTSILSILLSVFLTHAARADKRVALVIGNAAYQTLPKLAIPENDAAAIGQLLKTAEFDVTIEVNLNAADMQRVMRDFASRAKDADMVAVFFAGHGIEIDGTNYLVPVDAALKRDVDVKDEAVMLDSLVALARPANKLGLVMLDAGRGNPFVSTMERKPAARPVDRGSPKIEPPQSSLLIAYATKAGTVAADDQGTYSHFARALLDNLTTPGLDIRLAFGRVRDDVMKATNNRQQPFVYGSLDGGPMPLVEPLIRR